MTTDRPYDSDLEYIEDELAWIELRCKRIITKRLVKELTADDEAGVYYNQSYYHHDQSLDALIAKKDSLEKQERQKRFAIDGRLAATRAAGERTIALDELVELYELDQFDRTILLMAASITFSRRFVQMYGRMWEGYEALVVEAVFNFCELPFADRISHFKRFSARGKLFGNELCSLNFGGRIQSPQELLDAQITIANRTFDFLVGTEHFMDEFMEFSSVEEPRARFDQVVLDARDKDRIRSVVDRHEHYLQCRTDWGFDDIIAYGKGVLMLFYGKPGTGKTMMAHAVAHEMGMRVLNVDIPTFINHYDAQRFLPALFREAKMQNAVLFFDECEALFATRAHGNPLMTMLLTEIERFEGVAILATNLPQQLDEALDRRILVRVNFPEPDRAARRDIWEKHLPTKAPVADDVDLDALAEQFEITGGYIKNAVLMAVADAVHRGGDEPKITMQRLEVAAREQATPSNAEDSPVYTTDVRLRDVVLPDATRAQLEDLVAASRGRRGAVERMGVSSARGGIVGFISGPSGTGRSMCADAVANALNRPVRNIAIPSGAQWENVFARVESVFDEAHAHNAVLVLDCVDALVRDDGAQRWLASMLEHREGVTLLIADNADVPAPLSHRLDYRIPLQAPGPDARAAIWQSVLPANSGVAVHSLSELDLVGAQIERAAVRAAFQASQTEAALTTETVRAFCEAE